MKTLGDFMSSPEFREVLEQHMRETLEQNPFIQLLRDREQHGSQRRDRVVTIPSRSYDVLDATVVYEDILDADLVW